MGILTPPICDGPLPATDIFQPERAVGSLWRRVVAFILDGIVLAIAGNLIAFLFFESFSRLGNWGPLVGFFWLSLISRF